MGRGVSKPNFLLKRKYEPKLEIPEGWLD